MLIFSMFYEALCFLGHKTSDNVRAERNVVQCLLLMESSFFVSDDTWPLFMERKEGWQSL